MEPLNDKLEWTRSHWASACLSLFALTSPVMVLATMWWCAKTMIPGGAGFCGAWPREWDVLFGMLNWCFLGSLALMLISWLVLPVLWCVKLGRFPAGRWMAGVMFVLPILVGFYFWKDPFHMVSWWLD